jgi:gamma-F420-2:alpha-L-glutamate ligase
MKTELLSTALPSFDFPFVLKSLDGHGGSEVFLMRDRQALDETLAMVDKSNYLAQEFCSSPGKDMRVYVLSDEIVCGVLRTSTHDFRSNFSLGGEVCVCEVTPKQREIIQKLRTAIQFDLVGVDFIFHNGEWVLNEIEDVVGTRMLYCCTDMDIVDLYMRHILNRLA